VRRRRSAFRDFFEFLAVRILLATAQALPLQFCYSLAKALAWLAYRFDRRHRLVAHENLQSAYPHWPSDRRDLLIRQVYRHYCMMALEIAHLPRLLRPHTWKKYIALSEGRQIVSALLSGRPTLIVTGHLGNWELAGYALALFGFKSYAVARPLDNPFLDRLVRRFRRNTGQELLNKTGDSGKMISILDSGGILCTLADQDAGPSGVFVPFFGRPASTHKAVALLALHHNALLIVTAARRTGPGLNYLIDVETILDSADCRSNPQAVQQLTEDYTSAWERLVRKSPEQYLWLHRRWKHLPRAKSSRRLAA
jgi:KDO2-lipid IV(A) lauroyltransferase